MHPAPSIIAFTTLSGFGFGLLAWLGVITNVPTGWDAFVWFLVAYVFAVGGLVSSTLHLGRPERAWRALSQWQTSWLSCEGILAIATLVTMAIYGGGLIFFDAHWFVLGWAGSLLSLMTVFATAMIYAQLNTVPRWQTPLTPILFLTISISSGAILVAPSVAAIVLILVTGVIQIKWWQVGDRAFLKRGTTTGSATGLKTLGHTRPLANPHTSPNYLMTEFMYSVGRRHSRNLRICALLLMVLLPVALLTILPAPLSFISAIASYIFGVLVGRWLFFAEAEHVIVTYYDLT